MADHSVRPQAVPKVPKGPMRLAAALALCLFIPGQQGTAKEPPARPAADSSVPRNKIKGGDGEQVALIDKHISEKWRANKLRPSERCSDHEFLRRASLDIIGRIATPREIERFFKDPEATRREQLIERLLKDEDYADNWANIWKVWLLTRSGANEPGRSDFHRQMHGWLKEQFKKPVFSYKEMVTDILTATGRSSENGAVNYILAHLGEPTPRGSEAKEGRYDMVPVTSRTTRLFLGLQTQCAQCHKHPFNPNMEQHYFWGVNAFFRQVDTPRGRPMPAQNNAQAMAVNLELTDNPEFNQNGKVFYEQRNAVLLATRARFSLGLDRKDSLLPAGGVSRRQELARFITNSPYFGKAYVNRMWAHFFGRGFTNPVDDFNQENEPSHPELLDELASAFVHYGHDPRRLIRWICASNAYNLTCVANRTNAKQDDERFFSRMLLKAMSPEQLFESLMVATQAEMFESKDKIRELRDRWMARLTSSFGDDEGNEVTFNGTVVQALMMMNGADINSAITRMMSSAAAKGAYANKEKGSVAVTMWKGKSNQAILTQLYLAALNRPPTAKETSAILEIARKARVRSPDPVSLWQDVLWALLNSNEFILNH